MTLRSRQTVSLPNSHILDEAIHIIHKKMVEFLDWKYIDVSGVNALEATTDENDIKRSERIINFK